MEFIKLIQLSKTYKEEIFNLWNNEYPEKLNYQNLSNFDNYLKNLEKQSHVLMIDKNKTVKGWYFDFNREDEKWFTIILDTKVHGKGFGQRFSTLQKKKKPN